MARILLLADSNFVNNIGEFRGRKIRDLEVKSCQSRKEAMAELNSVEEGIVVISCLDMLAADVAKNARNEADNAVEFYYNQLLFSLVNMVDNANGKLAIGVVAPLFWSGHSEPVKRSMSHAFKTFRKTPLTNIWFTEFWKDINAGVDGTHLTSLSSIQYIQHIFSFIQNLGQWSGIGPVVLEGEGTSPVRASAPVPTTSWADENPASRDPDAVVRLNPPEESSPARTTSMVSLSMLSSSFNQPLRQPPPVRNPTADRLMRIAHEPVPRVNFSVPPPGFGRGQIQEQDSWRSSDVNSSLARIERRLGRLEAMSFFDNVMMAGLQEEQDAEANRASLSKVTMVGVPMPSLQGLNELEKIEAIKAKAAEIVDLIKEEGQTYKVVFVRHRNQQVRGLVNGVLEVRFEDDKQAANLRASFVKKQKEKDENLPAKLNITPVVRVATRVRVEILHSVANLLQRHDHSIVRAMCLQYIPKPVIKIVRKSFAGNEYTRTMTFIEAVCWVEENGYSGTINLSKAYERAGASFRGTMTQTFVLLHSTS